MQAAVLEQIVPDFESSMRILTYQKIGPHCLQYWHYHPEYELVYIDQGSSTRHIGKSIGRFENGDLILVGSNLPHRGFTEDIIGEHTEVIIQWHPEFMGPEFFNRPELKAIAQLLKRSQNGLSFFGSTKDKVGQRMLALKHLSNLERITALLSILNELSLSEEYLDLNAGGYSLIYRPKDQERIEAIFDFVKTNFQEEINLHTLAQLVNMTRQSFCRYFKQCTGFTFFEFLNQYRITQATQLLAETSDSIGNISYNCGFNNLSTFNKQFKKITGMTPLVYRKMYRRVLES